MSQSAINAFEPTVVDFNLPAGANPLEHVYQFSSPDNTSLTVAQNARFDEMCSDVLWGSEDTNRFGELLRGAVLTFLPENLYHLQLLKTVVSFSWQLDRLGATQHNLFEAGKGVRGKMGLPQGAIDARSMGPQVSDLLRDLQRAISIYHSVRGKVKK